MTNYEIEQLFNGLSELRQEVSESLPASIAFLVIRNIHMLAPIVEDYHSVRNSIIIANGVESKDTPGAYTVSEERIDSVNEQLIALAKTEIDVNLAQINYADLEKVNLTLAQMDMLYPMIRGEA